MAPAALARAAEERGFHSLYFPEHTHLPVRADTPPALVEGVAGRRLPPQPRSAGGAGHRGIGDRADTAGHRGVARRPARPDRAGQAAGHPRPPQRRKGRPRHGIRVEPRGGRRSRRGIRGPPGSGAGTRAVHAGAVVRGPGGVPWRLRHAGGLLELAQTGPAAADHHADRWRSGPVGVRGGRRVRGRLDAGRRFGPGRGPPQAPAGRRGRWSGSGSDPGGSLRNRADRREAGPLPVAGDR